MGGRTLGSTSWKYLFVDTDAHKMPVPSPSDGVWERAFYALSALCVRDIQGLAHDGGNHLLLPQVRRQVANLL